MKVLLGHKYFHLTAGNDFFFFETGRVLEQNGHEVAWFSTLDERNRPSEFTSYFVRPPVYRDGTLLQKMRDFPRMIYSREAKRKFAQLLADFKPDIVHLFGIFTQISPSILDACRAANVPVILSCNDYKMFCTNYRLHHHGRICEDCKGGRLYMSVVNKCCQDSWSFSIASCIEAYAHNTLKIYQKNVHTFLFASEFMASKQAEFWGEDTFRWRMLKNPFDPMAHPLSEGYDDYCLFFGSLLGIKGVDIIVKAMSQLPPNMRAVIVGDGPEEANLKALADELNCENVEFVGPKWGDELTPYLERARFVLVSSVWHENFPYVILQAFATGKAVLGADRGGIPELVRHGEFGLVYPADDPDALAEGIRRLWEDAESTVNMGKAARAYVVDEFNDKNFYDTVIEIYEDVLK